MSAVSLDALLDDISGKTSREAYDHKMRHEVPELKVVDRKTYILEACKDQTVLDIGAASGPLHGMIAKVATKTYGLDREMKTAEDYLYFDLERCHELPLPVIDGVTLVVAGEVLEHLANPGHVLTRLRAAYACPLLVTVPNAFSTQGLAALAKGIESVNRDHVAYYSYWTLRRLLERYGYAVTHAAWYNGKPKTAEGLIMLAEPKGDPDGS